MTRSHKKTSCKSQCTLSNVRSRIDYQIIEQLEKDVQLGSLRWRQDPQQNKPLTLALADLRPFAGSSFDHPAQTCTPFHTTSIYTFY